jgi:hypothetical protein
VEAQEVAGHACVWFGLALFVLQAVVTAKSLFQPAELEVKTVDKVIAALAEKFPAAAIGIAGAWMGANLLGWWPAG